MGGPTTGSPAAPVELGLRVCSEAGPAGGWSQIKVFAADNVATCPNGTLVTVNDAGAPLTYAPPGQLNAIVPYETGTSGIARIRVNARGQLSGGWDVAPAD